MALALAAVRSRELVTPEGVRLEFRLGSVADRAGAFFVDFMLIHLIVLVVLAVSILLAGAGLGTWAISMFLLTSFLVRNFYFIVLETLSGGQTPGKRRFGLRVVSRDGGALTSEAIFARNITRDVEFFLPLSVLLNPEALLPGLPAWAALLALGWVLVLALLPLLSRDGLRVGDLAGGTLVVRMPRPALLPDLVEERPASREQAPPEFTAEQLDLYGIKELRVLENILRQHREQPQPRVLQAVAGKIMRKIGWADRREDPERFLSAFYRAQRARLEHKLLFGIRKTEKSRKRLRREQPPEPEAGDGGDRRP